MPKLRQDAITIWNAGLESVRARPLVARSVCVDGDHLQIGTNTWSRECFDRVLVVGGGKAGTAMVEGLLQALDGWLPIEGWMNVPAGTEHACPQVTLHPARPAGVNEPTEAGVEGTREILRLVSHATSRDLCIVLLSGGGSALLPAPLDGITLQDKLAVTRHLSAGGADIVQLNTVRKHLSQIKGGGLRRACRAGHLITLVLSDVLGDPLDVIASGPTTPDSTTVEDAIAVLEQFDPQHSLPPRILQVLRQQQSSTSSRGGEASLPATGATARDGDNAVDATTVVLGNNALAVDEAGIQAEKLGYNHAMTSARRSEPSAEEVGIRLAEMTLTMLSPEPGAHRIDCLITGGEPTVKLADASIRGRGGRNQQLVLAAYQRLLQADLSEDQWRRLCLLAAGTDGEDGPTDAAGAWLDDHVHRRARQLGLDVDDTLRRNDAYTFFEATGGLFKTGPTGTNVCDLRVALVDASKPR